LVARPANLATNDDGTFTTFGTIIALPHGGPNCLILNGTTSQGYNFSDDTSCSLGDPTDVKGAGNDPKLGPLADNGGPAFTRLPLTGSPVIDAIPGGSCQKGAAAGVTDDERGVSRPQNVLCDIGAVEVIPPVVVQPTFTG